MTDGKYFTTDKNGEIFELKAALNSDERDKKCAAMTKVIILIFMSVSLLLFFSNKWTDQ